MVNGKSQLLLNRAWLSVLLMLMGCLLTIAQAQSGTNTVEAVASQDAFTGLIHQLRDAKLRKKPALVKQLGELQDTRVEAVLQALLDGRLYYTKDDRRAVVFKENSEKGYRITDVVSGTLIGEIGKRQAKKIGVNNTLRRILRSKLAELKLDSDDPEARLKAVKALSQKMDTRIGHLLRDRLPGEKDGDVRAVMSLAIAILDVRGQDTGLRLDAIEILATDLSPNIRNTLNDLLRTNADGSFAETDKAVVKAATDALKKIDRQVWLYGLVETLFFGLSLGSVLALSAIGLAITFGVMGVINMAHGELMMVGAYTTYVIQQLMPNYLDSFILVAIPAAFLVSALLGICIERGVIRFLYGRPLETLLATFGISLILQQTVRSIFSPLNRSVSTPSWMSGSLEINSVLSLTLNRLYIIAFALIVFGLLLMVLKKTRLGLQVRAVSQNRSMAKAMGIRSERVDALTFGLGSGIAGVAGVALSQLTNVGPNLGQSYIVDSFMVVVFGGVGNLWGTLISGMSLGVANKILEPFAGAVLAKILILVAIILFIQIRPRGLFPQKGRAAED
ncbi:MAG: urea ABC transporter permease subunit UrtB [Pseudomonadota bacterium]|nr:urea ABC transporter permease subunit UrtB [Pseudomonadota bacterium]